MAEGLTKGSIVNKLQQSRNKREGIFNTYYPYDRTKYTDSSWCYIDGGEGWSVARRVRDGSVINGTGTTLMCLAKASAEELGYVVTGWDQEQSDEETEYGFRD